ncbi:MAG: DNA polymerase III subunit delta [Rickettsia endosymbiont of Bryobia graminum]|nr:DNA polymerase III subunit delta [Rickettsia endosymbiont of Bryobia graminum]
MKLYLSQVPQLFEKIEGRQVNALLLYGPDKGYIDKICKALIKKFNLLKTSIEYSDLKNYSLDTLANSQNFFMQKQLIKIRSVGESIDKPLKLALGKDFLHFLVFIADELSSNSSIRKFFETENNLASLACYHDDEQKITKIISQKLAANSKIIQEESVRYLTNNLSGDHQVLINELDKLLYYTSDKNEITIEDVQSVITKDNNGNGDNLCQHFALGNLAGFLQEYEKLQQQNINEVLMIRALIRYYLNLYTVLNKLSNGINIDIAIKSLSPTVFYKNIPPFKKIINKITIEGAIKILNLLQQAEVDYKINSAGFDLYQQVYARVHNT